MKRKQPYTAPYTCVTVMETTPLMAGSAPLFDNKEKNEVYGDPDDADDGDAWNEGI